MQIFPHIPPRGAPRRATGRVRAMGAYVQCSCKGGAGRESMGDDIDEISKHIFNLASTAKAAAARAWRRAIGAPAQPASTAPALPPAPPPSATYPADAALVRALQMQINRFVGAPGALGVLRAPIAVTGVLDIGTATTATIILLARARGTASTYGDTGAVSSLLRDIGAGLTNPLPYIGKSLATATATIAALADVNGLPPAKSSVGAFDNRALLLGAAAAGAYLLWRSR